VVPVHLNSLTKQFDSGVGISNVSATIQPGEFFTLLGPSGCGKTTTLRMIAGFTFPTRGTIHFGDDDVTFRPPNRRNTGMVFQNYALFPHMTVFENIAFGLKIRKIATSERRTRVEKVLEQVRLAGLGDRKIGQLSGGQQQRVALARAIVIQPDILLLDEPLSNLDAKLREETRIQIRELQLRLGLTTVYVTHDQSEAMMVSDRIMVMNGGTVQQVARPQDLYARPANKTVAAFVGETNLLSAVITSSDDSSHVTLRVGDGLKLLALKSQSNRGITYREGTELYVSIRPEGILLGSETTVNIASGLVQAVEFGGILTYYSVQVAGLKLRIARTNPHKVWHVGDSLNLCIPLESIFIVEQGE